MRIKIKVHKLSIFERGDTLNNAIGVKIKIARLKKGYKKGYEFAEKVGISRAYLTMLENGRANNPSMDLMRRIAKELDTTPQELFFE